MARDSNWVSRSFIFVGLGAGRSTVGKGITEFITHDVFNCLNILLVHVWLEFKHSKVLGVSQSVFTSCIFVFGPI